MKNKFSKKRLVVLVSLILIIGVAAVIISLFKNDTATQTLADICPDLTKDGLVQGVWWINARINTPEGTEETGIEAQNIKKALSALEISKNPVNSDLSFDRDKTVSIAFEEMKSDYPTNAFSEIVYFNKDFTEVWINDEGTATYTYKVISPEKARKITEINKESFENSQTVQDLCPDLTGDKKFKNLFLTTQIYRAYETSSEYCGMLINDIQGVQISAEPISDELFDISEAYNIIEFSYNWANDYYSPRYKYEFCFNKDYSEMWLVIDDVGGLKYKVFEPQLIEDMCSVANYNITVYYGMDEEKLKERYDFSESLKNVKLKIDWDLLPEIGDETRFEVKSDVRRNYWLDKYEGYAYSLGNTGIKLKSISYGDSEYITLSFCIVNTIPDYGEVLYGKSIDGNNREELYDLLENLTIKCGSEIYTDAVMYTFPRYNCFDISIKKEVYSKLKGKIEILYPLVSLNLKEK
ncbi:MAG: hypothetical protein E7564_06870 [Ruminococcaceae bacterium]|nr:hypothetical protein [Oscillospiraceae bacterium]